MIRPDELPALWHSLAARVLDAGLALATNVNPPAREVLHTHKQAMAAALV
jgi:hypothetical protein